MIKLKKYFALFLFLGFINSQLFAQQSTTKKDEQPDEIKRINEFSKLVSKRVNFFGKDGNSLTRMEELRSLEREYPATTNPGEFGMLSFFLQEQASFIGDYRAALRYADFNQPKNADRASDSEELKGFRSVSAIKAISEVADTSQIVMINEAHHVPQNRALTYLLLKALKKKGFNYFAAETLSEKDAELDKRGYPIADSGTYMREPLYGDLVRLALKLGYQVIPYDKGFDEGGKLLGPDARERAAAENLRDRIFANNPKAKVLIHVGYGHNSELARANGNWLLAGYLKEFLGIDPLTIDQTLMREHSAPEYENSLYRLVMSQRKPNDWIVFRNSQNKFWAAKNLGRDMTVFSPRSVYVNERPTWLRLNDERKEYLLAADVCQTEKNCFVRARFSAESAAAVPADQIEVQAGRKKALILPRGDFIIELEDVTGKKMKSWQVKR